MSRLLTLTVLLSVTAGCSFGGSEQEELVDGPPYDCGVLLDDAQFDGLRLVEAMSNGSNEDLCFLAPADEATAGATVSAPVVGKRVVVRRNDGTLAEVSEVKITAVMVDPGDDGPLVKPR